MRFHKEVLRIDCASETERLLAFLRRQVVRFRRDGIIVGISGGIDSAVMVSLAVKALGAEKVMGLILPEVESNPISREYAERLAQRLQIKYKVIDMTPALKPIGIYDDPADILKEVFPEYNTTYKYHIVLPQDLLERDRFNVPYLRLRSSQGKEYSFRLSKSAFLGLTAAANVKLRMRMVFLYYYAERHNLLVAGTTNRSEYLLGYFGKYGDGGTDIEALAHLYKTQIYALARYLGVSEEIINRDPSPDTYSLPVTDKDFFFCIPYETLDMLLYAWEHKVPVADVCKVMGLTSEQVKRAFKDFEAKAAATWHFRRLPPTIEDKE